MTGGLVIADSGPVFSLAILDKLGLLNTLFREVYIPGAVWEELSKDETAVHYPRIQAYFQGKVREVSGFNELTFIMDYGESEAVLLYQELGADYLVIDDKKARDIAESLGISCIGTIGLLAVSKERRLIGELRPLFVSLLDHRRYFSVSLLNTILAKYEEAPL